MFYGSSDYNSTADNLVSCRLAASSVFRLICLGHIFLIIVNGSYGSSVINRRSVTGVAGNALNQTSPIYLQESARKEYIKYQILQRLGLNEKPVVDLSHKISRDLVLETLRRTDGIVEFGNQLSVVGDWGDSNNNTDESIIGSNYAKTSEIISFPDRGPVVSGQTLLSFSYAGNQAFGVGVRVRKAHLWVKLNYESSLSSDFAHVLYPDGVTILVFQIQENFSNPPQAQSTLTLQDVPYALVIKRKIPIDSLGWQKFDVTAAVNKWYSKLSRHRIRHPHHPHGHARGNVKLNLLIECNGCRNSVKPVLFPKISPTMTLDETQESTNNNVTFDSSSSTEDHSLPPHPADSLTELPFLVVETETAQNVKRNRRRTLECSPRVKQCCKQRFFISFQDLGWEDWIIAPRGYYANYCRGHCGGVHRTPDTFLNYHTHVMEEFRRTPAGQMELNGLTPCCAPTKFSSMSLIYFGPDLNIIKRDLGKMIVEECGCP